MAELRTVQDNKTGKPGPETGTPKPETVNRTPDAGNGGKTAVGPLAQAIAAGANVGAVDRPPLPEAGKAEPAAEGLSRCAAPGANHDVLKQQMEILMASPDLKARVKALKLAKQVATPDMAGVVLNGAMVRAELRGQTEEHIKKSEEYLTKREARLKNNNSASFSKSDEQELVRESLASMLETIHREANEVLLKLYGSDPQGAVAGIVPVFLQAGQALRVNQWNTTEENCAEYTYKLVQNILLGQQTAKHPSLLLLADEMMEAKGFYQAATIVKLVGLPEGAATLGKLAQHAADWLGDNHTPREFLDACGAVGTPECLPLLAAVKDIPELHERTAEVAAKILGIELA